MPLDLVYEIRWKNDKLVCTDRSYTFRNTYVRFNEVVKPLSSFSTVITNSPLVLRKREIRRARKLEGDPANRH